MIDDSAICEMEINTSDDRFWGMTPYDKYWKCDDEACMDSTSLWRSGVVTQSTDTTNNWECPLTDDDSDAPYCTAPTSADSGYGIYQCKQIKCVHQRMLYTGDELHDF